MNKHISFGQRLKSAREAKGIDRKEIASQLRLNEQVIIMIESGEFKTDLPMMFIRGYIRTYSKLLDIPEQEVTQALALLQPPTEPENTAAPTPTQPIIPTVHIKPAKPSIPLNMDNVYMKVLTYLIGITVIGLVALWWNSNRNHTSKSIELSIPKQTEMVAEPQPAATLPPSPNARINEAPPPGNKALETTPNIAPANVMPAAPAAAQLTPIPNAHKADKTVLIQHIKKNNLQPLLDLILLLAILTIGMRQYAREPTITHARTARPANTRYLKIHKPWPALLKPYSTEIAILLLTLTAIFSLGITWRHHHAKVPLMIASAKKPIEVSNPPPPPAPTISWDVDLDTLTPPLNLTAALMATVKMNALQAMVVQLDDYATQAEMTKFVLTDVSTPIGQFSYKKKGRKRRNQPAYYYENSQAPIENTHSANMPFTY